MLMPKFLVQVITGLIGAFIGCAVATPFGFLIALLAGHGISVTREQTDIVSQIISTTQIIGASICAYVFMSQWLKAPLTKQLSIEIGAVVAVILFLLIINSRLESQSQMRSEAKKVLYAVNMGQHAFHELNNQFATSIEQLDFKNDSKFYRYDIIEVDPVKAIARATPQRDDLKSYVAGISKINDKFFRITCESRNNIKSIQSPTLDGTDWHCGKDSTQAE
jgi:type II secretory pathway pseudopilin PulG